MKHICQYAKTCYARGYCFHAREHDLIPVVSGTSKETKCNEEYLCTFTESRVSCIEVKE